MRNFEFPVEGSDFECVTEEEGTVCPEFEGGGGKAGHEECGDLGNISCGYVGLKDVEVVVEFGISEVVRLPFTPFLGVAEEGALGGGVVAQLG